jgi:hypothetical protein
VVVSGLKPDTNFSHYGTVDADGDGKVDSIDDLIEKARLELDADKQSAMWQEAQIQLLNHAAVVPIIRGPDPAPESCGRGADHPAEIRLPDEVLCRSRASPGFQLEHLLPSDH